MKSDFEYIYIYSDCNVAFVCLFANKKNKKHMGGVKHCLL